ncbi:hypothetical protein BOTBODRAFT_33349 [Botryobasidium botryosum FD-172 SS1]|uniref:Uncharacterized protein n=1 Tax=Botryobasidium botryosum (strain FD-172 SS1) TaxID=930990 RepID=A0A067MD00_BOTB1|nr:hypothetical protein BOTBODRAFT_33349 [Botryobasidium botryosum FD-172 SS1]
MATHAEKSLAVHRCRFLDWNPSPIAALAFAPTPPPKKNAKKQSTRKHGSQFGILAVGRANGNIEICEWSGADWQQKSPQAWVVRRTLRAPKPSKIESLVLALRYPESLSQPDVPGYSDLRLFSTSGGSDLFEWDLERGTILRTVPSQGGSIWSMAVNPTSTLLALGCEDGRVRLLSLADNDVFHHSRFMPAKAKSRVLSIAWGIPSRREGPDGEEWSDAWLVTGYSDSTVRKWDVRTGQMLDQMSVDKVRDEKTLVWAVGVLRDGTIVSGDSLGMVKFWDSLTATQLQSFQAHAADILCLAIGPDGTSVYSSGVDQKVTEFSAVNVTERAAKASSRFIQTCSRRLHSHDVRALAIWPPFSPFPITGPNSSQKTQYQHPAAKLGVAPILASGGLDMSVALCPCAPAGASSAKLANPLSTSVAVTFEDAYHRRMAYTTTDSVRVSRGAKLLLCAKDTSVVLWRVRRDPKDMVPEALRTDRGWDKLLEVQLKVQTNIQAIAISEDGRWMAVSDLHETKLFRLTYAVPTGKVSLKRVKRFSSSIVQQTPQLSSSGASCLIFTPDSRKIIVASAAIIVLVDLSRYDEDGGIRVLRSFSHHRVNDIVVGDDGAARAVKGLKPSTEDKASDPAEEGTTSDSDSDDESDGEMLDAVDCIIARMAVSLDEQWLATADTRGRTHVYNVDTVQHHCALPSFEQPPSALAFDPHSPNTLIIGLPNNTLQIFDVEARQFPDWARTLCEALPKRFTHLHDPLVGITFDPAPQANAGPEVYLWGSTWICKVNLQKPVGYPGFTKRKRRHGHDGGHRAAANGDGAASGVEENFRLVTKYRPLLAVDFFGPAELVVVERPLVDVLETLPPAFFKPKYGS